MSGNFLRKAFGLQAKSDDEWNNLKKKAASCVAYEAESKIHAEMNARQFRLDLARSMIPQDDTNYKFSVKTNGQDLSNPVLQVIRRVDDSVLAEWSGHYSRNEWDNIREINFVCPAHGAFPTMLITAAEPGKEDGLGWSSCRYSYKDRKKDFLFALGKAVHVAEQSVPANTRGVRRLKL